MRLMRLRETTEPPLFEVLKNHKQSEGVGLHALFLMGAGGSEDVRRSIPIRSPSESRTFSAPPAAALQRSVPAPPRQSFFALTNREFPARWRRFRSDHVGMRSRPLS